MEGVAHGELQELIWNDLKGYDILIFRREEFAEINYAQQYPRVNVTVSLNHNLYASNKKSHHQAFRGSLNKLTQSTGAHVGTANPP